MDEKNKNGTVSVTPMLVDSIECILSVAVVAQGQICFPSMLQPIFLLAAN